MCRWRNTDTYADGYSYTYGYGHSHGFDYSDAETDADASPRADAETSSYTSAKSIVGFSDTGVVSQTVAATRPLQE